jgi:hypothetical protein
MRRAGDTNVRIDIVAERSGALGVVQFESSFNAVEAPRSVLDGLAVVRARYAVAAELTVGAIIMDSLPNGRSDFWQVLLDIRNVLGIEISTLTPVALIMLVWSHKELEQLPYSSANGHQIRNVLETVMGKQISVPMGFAAALEPTK